MPALIYEQLHRDGLAARDARLKAEQDQDELASLRHGKASLRLDLALIRLRRALRRKDRTDQPRVPAGQVGGGQSRRAAAAEGAIRYQELGGSPKSSEFVCSVGVANNERSRREDAYGGI